MQDVAWQTSVLGSAGTHNSKTSKAETWLAQTVRRPLAEAAQRLQQTPMLHVPWAQVERNPMALLQEAGQAQLTPQWSQEA